MKRERRLGPAVVLGLALAAATLGSGCGASDSLSGSIGESFNLDYDYVVIRKQALSLTVEYIHLYGGGEDKVLKLTVEGHLLLDEDGQRIPMESGLVIDGDHFDQVVRIERVSGQGTTYWPSIHVGVVSFGRLDFETDPVGGVAGRFDLVFDNGRTLAGSFSGPILVTDMS